MKNDKNTMACHTTPRLDALLKILQNSKSVADIGCDHAYLSILLARADENKKIIGADIKEGPLNRARENVERFGLSGRIELRLGDGLSPLKSGEVDTIVIAGMGALVISGILNEGAAIAKKADRLVLQPMSSAHELRSFCIKTAI
ncbi:MAG: SAM-dependent methyltransferase [Ruminococcaceae bacterium]|nr:SAM-dependent methyltransferase [Oscillospiraceae bacterium]